MMNFPKRGNFGTGKNEFKIEVSCVNGSDCLSGTIPITVYSDGCHCDIYNEIEGMYKKYDKYKYHNPSELPKEMNLIIISYCDFEDETRIYYEIVVYTNGTFDELHDNGYRLLKWKYLEK